jgi:hypothetical protein
MSYICKKLKQHAATITDISVNNLCTITELTEALGEHRKNIERYAKTFREKGAEYFFRRKETR